MEKIELENEVDGEVDQIKLFKVKLSRSSWENHMDQI